MLFMIKESEVRCRRQGFPFVQWTPDLSVVAALSGGGP
jgi:hypothetical protein